MFNKLLPQPSELITVTLPRPLGVVFEYDQRFKRAVVVDTVEGSAAAQKQKVAGLNPRLAKETMQTGVIRMGTEHDIRAPPGGRAAWKPPPAALLVSAAAWKCWLRPGVCV